MRERTDCPAIQFYILLVIILIVASAPVTHFSGWHSMYRGGLAMNTFLTRISVLSFVITILFACSSSTGSDLKGPKVVETMPPNGALDVVVNRAITANFDSAMDGLTLNNDTFTLRGNGGALVPCVITTVDSLAVLTPMVNLDTNTIFRATISTGAKSLEGSELENDYEWSFTTGVTLGKGPSPIALGKAGDYAILAKSGIDSVPTSVVTGDLGVSPAAATYITGFDVTAHASNVYSTSAQVVGKIYASDYAVPTPANLTTAISNMESAYVDAAGRTLPDHVNLGAGNISAE